MKSCRTERITVFDVYKAVTGIHKLAFGRVSKTATGLSDYEVIITFTKVLRDLRLI
jgi:hypothetical protein